MNDETFHANLVDFLYQNFPNLGLSDCFCLSSMYVRTRFDSAHKMAAIESAMNHGYSNKVPIGIFCDYFVPEKQTIMEVFNRKPPYSHSD